MRIYMVTNVYRPKVGGVTRSIDAFAEQYRLAGHHVRIIAPSFDGYDEQDKDVLRIPAMHNVLEEYSLPVPYPGLVSDALEQFRPDVVHAHHPFLLGATAHKMAAMLDVPVVYTHHSRFDAYGNYFPKEHGFLQRFVIHLSVHFANLCHAVIAPGTFVRDMLKEAGVTSPIHVIPTGVNVEKFRAGDGPAVRRDFGVPQTAPLVGHVGRLAEEKNLGFLARAVARLMQRRSDVHFLLVGGGPAESDVIGHFKTAGVADRLHATGILEGQRLIDAYHALDVFAFSSKSETQGMVITEAMAAGVPVVALRASGVEDVLHNGENGFLLENEDADQFTAALQKVLDAEPSLRGRLIESSLETARQWSIEKCARQALSLYQDLVAEHPGMPNPKEDPQAVWDALARRLKDELALLKSVSKAAGEALVELNFD